MTSGSTPDLSRRRRVVGGLLGTGVLGAWWLYGHPPTQSFWYPQCLFHEITGLHCPGCGATRALYALLHGNLLEALHQNAAAVVAVPFVSVAAGRSLWRWVRGEPPPLSAQPNRWLAWLMWIVAPLVILFGIVRNLPWAPFTCLAPY